MDSCSSSPSHSFKDHPRSLHGDLPRQPIPCNLDRVKSLTPKGVTENRDGLRDFARHSGYGVSGSEKEGGDALLSSPERSRGSLRKSFGFERVERHCDSKTELHRSTRSPMPSCNPDRENIETAGRPSSRRSSHGGDGHRHEVSEGLSSSPHHGRAFKRGFDRESVEIKLMGSSSPDFDGEASRSPASGKGIGFMKNDGKDSLRGSPTTSLVCSTKRDLGMETRTSQTSPGRMEGVKMGKLSSPIKVSGRETHKDQEASSGETETSKNFWIKSCSGGGDEEVEGEQWLKENGSHDARSPPISFLHISKKVRSDRDRGRRDEHTIKASVRHAQGNQNEEQKECSAERSGCGIALMKMDEVDAESGAMCEANYKEESCAKSTDSDAVHANERSSEKMEIESPVSNNGDKSDMEEGELEAEGHIELGKFRFMEEKFANSKEMEKIKEQNCAVISRAPKGKEVCNNVLREDVGEEKTWNAHVDEICSGGDDNTDVKTKSSDRKEKQGVSLEIDMVDLQFKGKSSHISMTKALELGETSETGLTLDLLGTRTEAKSWNSLSADKGFDMNRELKLSLFTKPSDVGEALHPRGDSQTKGSNGKQIESSHDLEAGLIRTHGGGSGEESSQHSGHMQKKLKMESLQLSLALPGSSKMGTSSNALCRHVEPERSFQSLNHTQTQAQNPWESQTYTNSEDFTMSLSFSQSESFIHNPSCSLNCTSVENQELSCGGSRQLSQGTEHMSARSWSGNEHMSNGMHTVTSSSHDKSKHRRDIPLYQRVLQNGSMHQGFPSVTGSNRSSGSNHVSQKSHHFGQRLQEVPKILDSSSQDLEESGRQVTSHKDIMERVRQQKAWFASKQQAMSVEPQPEPNALQARDKLTDPPVFNVKGPSSAAGNDMMVGERNASSDRIGLHEITTEPIAVMAQKLQELPDSFLEGLKSVAKGVLRSFEKREEFIGLQDNICRRMDLTEDTLLRAHRTQLEILVALKTGMQAFVQEGSKPQTYKALIEIFLQTRCRNLACQQLLPVGRCECRICSTKSGFCQECMCVVCLKFDSEKNSCRWVGCNLCLHWCHTDCGLRMSYIAPTSTGKDSTEKEYHCVACDHKSELFGYVKDVFHKRSENWSAEALAKELDCVRRIFHGSEDMRGKQLCWKAEHMLQKLENNVDAAEVRRSMLRFFQEGNAELDGACGPNKKSSSFKANDAPGHMANLVRESVPKTTSSGGRKLVNLDNIHAVLKDFDRNLEEKKTKATELQYDRTRKRAEIEDIESVARVKQAEAKMFQIRADEARQEAGGLQQIISVKWDKIDEDYECKHAKLRLSEAEEQNQKQFEELRALENAQQEFQKMKIRMEAEIKELMLKMEVAKRQFV